jgi:hypothetical protein
MSNAHSGLVQGIPTFGGRVHPPATVRDGAGVAQVRPLVPELPRALWALGNDAVVSEDGPRPPGRARRGGMT